nr:immunoglobulin heavy chain junction region [Mus musculus]
CTTGSYGNYVNSMDYW